MASAGSSSAPQGVSDWRREYAYTLGEQAFVYGFPYIYNAQLRHGWVTEPADNLIANPIDRYSIGDRTRGLVTEPDGSLTLHLQPDSPGSDRENNWLPTPKEGIWFVALRMYLPHPEVIDARWQCPPVTRVG